MSSFLNKLILSEVEVYEISKVYNINIPQYFYMPYDKIDKEKFIQEALSFSSSKVVVKIVSSKNLHKTDVGGVKVVSKDKNSISKIFDEMILIECDGILAVEFLEHSPALGEEILIGIKYDNAFGFIMMIGPGGTYTEKLIKSIKKEYIPEFLSLPCSDEDIVRFIGKSWTFSYTLGKVRGVFPKTTLEEIVKTLKSFINLVIDFEKKNLIIEELEVNPFIVSNGKLYAADGVLRFKSNIDEKRVIPTECALDSLTSPKNIAFCGVSEKKYNMGRIILNNTIKAGFSKENMYIIKDGVESIDGIKCYKNLLSIPSNKIDMYIISVPVDNVVDVIKEVADSSKVNGVVLITGGVGEKSGTDDIQHNIISLVEKARKNNPDFALNGGNCMGIVLNRTNVNTFFIPEYKMRPPIGKNPNMVPSAFVSQSGAFVISTLTKIPHIVCDYTITVGNQQDVTVVDYIDYFSKKDVKVILSYIEGFKSLDGRRLIEISKRMKSDGKILVIYKAGRTSVGQKAVMGHTASIAGDYIVFEKLLNESGAIICSSFDEFCDMAFLTTYASLYNFENNRAFFLSNAGFETTGMGDNISFLEPFMGDETLKEKINQILKKFKLDLIVDFRNPMDLTPMACDEAIAEIITAIYESGFYSSIFVSMIPLTPAMNTIKSQDSPDDFGKSFINYISQLIEKKNVFISLCVGSGNRYDSYVEYAIEKGFVVFRSADRMIKSFEKFIYAIRNS
ncbi:MAG: acetate--CoA ligase family protein [Elusimicrobiales bacterium]|nr:acetate--CoA ligase family protein [Elusimicrobiales bacterium]